MNELSFSVRFFRTVHCVYCFFILFLNSLCRILYCTRIIVPDYVCGTLTLNFNNRVRVNYENKNETSSLNSVNKRGNGFKSRPRLVVTFVDDVQL